MSKFIIFAILNFFICITVLSQNISGKTFEEHTILEQSEFRRYANNKDSIRRDILLKIYKGHFDIGYKFDDVVCALYFTGHKYAIVSEVSAVIRGSNFMIINVMVDEDIADIVILKFENRNLIGYERKKEKL